LPAASIALQKAASRDTARMLVVQPDGVLRIAASPSFHNGWSPATNW
jgi:hypothetical protein